MSRDRSQVTRGQGSPAVGLPGTPRPPFDPPQRRSSLAFSRQTPTSTQDKPGRTNLGTAEQLTCTPNCASNGRRTVSLQQSNPQPYCATRVRQDLLTAKASLHVDMHFAASPEGSIDARLPLLTEIPSPDAHSDPHGKSATGDAWRSWRYSYMPQNLDSVSMDVREPIQEYSPTLPEILPGPSPAASSPIEPPSSGFVPLSHRKRNGSSEPKLPPLPSSPSDLVVDVEIDSPDFPDRARTFDDRISDNDVPHPSIAPDAAQCPENSMRPDLIFMSESAEAAAQSAKSKRILLKQKISDDSAVVGSDLGNKVCPNPLLHRRFPNLASQRLVTTQQCPDPLLHFQAYTAMLMPETPTSNLADRMTAWSPMEWTPVHAAPSLPQRVTATGSPMPFTRRNVPADLVSPANLQPHSGFLPQVPTIQRSPVLQQQSLKHFRNTTLPAQTVQPRPSYCSQSNSLHPVHSSAQNLYSFSTAAAKVIGESAAPDSRIRDSYRTDTLVPLTLAPGRYRKIRIRPEQDHRACRRFRGSLVNGRVSSVGPARPDGQNLYHPAQDMRSHSSPLRPSPVDAVTGLPKRPRYRHRYAPEFNAIQDETTILDAYGNVKAGKMARPPVRLSGFGSDTLSSYASEQEQLRKLSPVIRMWEAKSMSKCQSWKQRRPGHWDDDLEEVRIIPATRGDIASSPTMSKHSMAAEVDHLNEQSRSACLISPTRASVPLLAACGGDTSREEPMIPCQYSDATDADELLTSGITTQRDACIDVEMED